MNRLACSFFFSRLLEIAPVSKMPAVNNLLNAVFTMISVIFQASLAKDEFRGSLVKRTIRGCHILGKGLIMQQKTYAYI